MEWRSTHAIRSIHEAIADLPAGAEQGFRLIKCWKENHMKRFFAALLAALMVFSLVTIPAVAEGEVVFEVPTVNAQPGDTVSIPVTLTGSNFECHAMNMNVQYDAEALTLNSATEGDAISGATMKVLDMSVYVMPATSNVPEDLLCCHPYRLRFQL